MERHDPDLVALVFGVTFVVLGTAYAIARWSWSGVDGGWLLGAFLIALGAAGIVSVATRPRQPAARGASADSVDASR